MENTLYKYNRILSSGKKYFVLNEIKANKKVKKIKKKQVNSIPVKSLEDYKKKNVGGQRNKIGDTQTLDNNKLIYRLGRYDISSI